MGPSRQYSTESRDLQLSPSLTSNCCARSLTWFWSRGRGGAHRRRCVGDGGVAAEHQGARALPWVAAACTTVSRRGLATRAGDDGWADTDGSSARRWRYLGKRRDAHGVARGMRRRGRLGLRRLAGGGTMAAMELSGRPW